MIAVVVLLVILVLLAVFVITQYNSLVRLRNETQNAWAQVDVVLRRRYDLVPNLVETVKGYAAHERETLEAVIQARSGAIDASAVADQADSENMLSGALRRLFALSEAYPALKADSNFMELQKELVQTEGLIGYARGSYNESVLAFNNKGQVFPSNIIASMFNFVASDFFEIEDEATGPVSVQF
jgi:LemA protein